MKDHLKLLTPDLRKKVEDMARGCFEIAMKHYGIPMDYPEIRYDIKSWTGGLAYRDRNLIRLNLILLIENEKHYIENVVPHEVAHMIVNECFKAGKFKLAEGKKRHMPHGKEWKEVMSVLKVAADVKHHYDCSSIEKFAKRKKKSNSIDRVQRIMKQIMKLTENEQSKIVYELERLDIFDIA